MHERDLNNGGNNDAVVSIPQAAEREAERRSGFRSRVTREGAMSFEIEIPRDGPTYEHRCCLYKSLGILFFFLLGGIVPSVFAMVDNDAIPVYALILTIGPLFFIFPCLWINKLSAFTQANLKITRDNYCLSKKDITWKSFFQIILVPSHFDDFESGQFVETGPREYRHDRHASLRAKIVTHLSKDSCWEDIKLGSISFAQGLKHKELKWLVKQINRFLRETS